MHGDTTASPAHLDNVTITSTVTIQVPSAEINAICVCVCVWLLPGDEPSKEEKYKQSALQDAGVPVAC